MVHIDVAYTGQLRCTAVHGPSGTSIITDAPVDNHGKGESFSPTDLVATAAASCMLTIMGIRAERDGIDLSGTTACVEKHMTTELPRRIATLEICVSFGPAVSEDDKPALKRAALSCPVLLSLSPEIAVTHSFD